MAKRSKSRMPLPFIGAGDHFVNTAGCRYSVADTVIGSKYIRNGDNRLTEFLMKNKLIALYMLKSLVKSPGRSLRKSLGKSLGKSLEKVS